MHCSTTHSVGNSFPVGLQYPTQMGSGEPGPLVQGVAALHGLDDLQFVGGEAPPLPLSLSATVIASTCPH